ncbi:MAG: hypothetical protein JGK17_16020 [Microcoleus sp. PH2017_10_PVI_O_A]|uniref:hypothetical protein n=1 Tax=unclassified Microcoleus TaxID=2642155 RepID=UPI001DAD2597|nr:MULTISPECIES: hypothetical protein [unclassified Microcoleus]TAE80387.1 MAG: hypothetical protein EAZ83_18460 [Oscillatoriales cyanobacterium]MCC3407067.1 hypothetical protein [Microcoleus sp. PH2017_10_PVI_O_A]MCC3461831.1 hypothetical protein [Microcoleus sp. PH2017_11_PCY_U_A]MCC3477968.1 hypothetical protein [Microcoleus sp. PH2017_12_PCY_D_A]MCC3529076.1 hypothetical protein [Microcoleus sp. PH2017_21_RUC_O_A]
MKFWKIVLVVLVIAVNFVFAPASWAGSDKPKYTSNPDYIEVTQSLNTLLAAKNSTEQSENYTPEELQNKIAQLEFQKYTLETGKSWGQCRNDTGKTLAIYGTKRKESPGSYENALYFLGAGETTEHKWDCDGVYLPSDVTATDLSAIDKVAQALTGGVAVKIVDGTQLVATANPETAAVEFNVPTAKVFKPGEVNWFIPDVSQAYIDTQVPNAPTEEND